VRAAKNLGVRSKESQCAQQSISVRAAKPIAARGKNSSGAQVALDAAADRSGWLRIWLA
jgi:hypothetical protein